jgi:uncharacterized tellurite resistance protein B-like protein
MVGPAEVTYESIAHLVASSDQVASTMQCVFKCPETGVQAEASASVSQSRGIKNVAQAAVKRSLFSSLRRAVSSTLYSTLGHSVAGRAASEVGREMMASGRQQTMYSKEDKEAAIAKAFKRVMGQFRYDEDSGRYKGAPAGQTAETGFGKQLSDHPVTGRYEQGVLARMLVEIACADGTVSDDEREFLADFIDPEVGTIDELATREKLTAVDLEEAAAGGVRETMLMLAWTAALSDEGLADSEKERLQAYAPGLGLAPERAEEVRQLAVTYLLDEAFANAYPGGRRDAEAHGEAMAYAEGMGVDAADAQRADIRYRKRNGIV